MEDRTEDSNTDETYVQKDRAMERTNEHNSTQETTLTTLPTKRRQNNITTHMYKDRHTDRVHERKYRNRRGHNIIITQQSSNHHKRGKTDIEEHIQTPKQTCIATHTRKQSDGEN